MNGIRQIGRVYATAPAVVLWIAGVLIGLSGLTPAAAVGQSVDGDVSRRAVVLGDSLHGWPPAVPPRDSLSLVEYYQGLGYLAAAVDSISRGSGSFRAWVTRGPRFRLRSVDYGGTSTVLTSDQGDALGRALTAGLLDSLSLGVLEAHERAGQIGSVVSVDSLILGDGTADVRFRVKPGWRPLLTGILVSGETRVTAGFIRRVTGLRPDRLLTSFDAAAIQARLRATGLFELVERPLLVPIQDSSAVVQIIVRDLPPGSFDLALGYLPGTSGGGGSLVGSGRLALANLFGGGRRLAFELDRLPGQSSSLDALFADPYLAGSLLGVEASFSGYQQDSTFSTQRYEGALAVRLSTVSVTGHVTREVARPGVAGISLVEGAQRIPDSRSRLAGIGMRLDSRDDPVVPRSGVEVQVKALQGRKTSSGREIVAGDTLQIDRALAQQRIEGHVRFYQSLGNRVVVAVGTDVGAIVADRVDQSDLYRLGGAKSLRGYDEDRFRGTAVSRSMIELRRVLDPVSYGYLFADLGMVQNASTLLIARTTRWYPGYGLGIQLQTAAGLLDVSYAANREDGLLRGRIHIGVAFGL